MNKQLFAAAPAAPPLNKKPYNKKESPKTFVSELSVKEGGYLLSRIALQYHRR